MILFLSSHKLMLRIEINYNILLSNLSCQWFWRSEVLTVTTLAFVILHDRIYKKGRGGGQVVWGSGRGAMILQVDGLEIPQSQRKRFCSGEHFLSLLSKPEGLLNISIIQ